VVADYILHGVVGVSKTGVHNIGFVFCYSFLCVTTLLIKS